MALRRLFHAPIVGDAHAVFEPGALLLCGSEIEAVGTPESIGVIDGCPAVACSEEAILPGLVNAHCHLDLSSLGPIGCEGGFSDWIRKILDGRAKTPEMIRQATQVGVEMALKGGTVAVGDIAGIGSWAPYEVLAASVLRGRSYIEVFGIGPREAAGVEAIKAIQERAEGSQNQEVGVGISPHAPYTCSPRLFQVAAASGLPVASHVAETLEEIEFCTSGSGSFVPMLQGLGIDVKGDMEWGQHPFDVCETLFDGGWVIAHGTYPLNEEKPRIERLAARGATVAYCPRATAFFGHASHPWRAYLAAGVPVALGTDGLPCLDTLDRISILDEIRWLMRHDGASLAEVLPMATTAGALAVGIEPSLVDLQPGPSAGIMRVDVFGAEAPEWIVPPEGISGR